MATNAKRTPTIPASLDEPPMQTTGPQVLTEPEGGWPPDEFTGQAGSFIRDPYTGVRTRAPEIGLSDDSVTAAGDAA